MEKIKIYTDGSCNPNPGRGGWAFAISKKEFKHGTVEETTNNIMEMTAIVEAIGYAKHEFPMHQIEIHSDSKYCVNGFNSWMRGWERKGWKKKGGPIKNLDLWKTLWEIREGVRLVWVRGHNGNEMNEFVDELASNGGHQPFKKEKVVTGYRNNPECYNHLIGIFQKHSGIKLSEDVKEVMRENMMRRFDINVVD